MNVSHGNPASTGATRQTRWRIGLSVAAAATLLAFIEASRSYVVNVSTGSPTSWLTLLRGSAPSWAILALLTPLPLAAARRVPLGRVPTSRALAIHALGAIAFSAVHVLSLALHTAWLRGTTADFDVMLLKFSSLFAADLMIYAAVAGAAHALRFSREAKERELAASQLQASLTEARLGALRGQLNPHFLFNTLNAISTMALGGDRDGVVRTLGYLSDLLRTALDERLPQRVPLTDELSFLERYLDIQRTRLGDRLTVHQEIDADTLGGLVPSMVLQPLVENAVTHGVAKIPGRGDIWIRARRDGRHLRIEIENTSERPADIDVTSLDAQTRREPSAGIGLTNTRARLQQLYPNDHVLTFDLVAGHGARLVILLPFETAA